LTVQPLQPSRALRHGAESMRPSLDDWLAPNTSRSTAPSASENKPTSRRNALRAEQRQGSGTALVFDEAAAFLRTKVNLRVTISAGRMNQKTSLFSVSSIQCISTQQRLANPQRLTDPSFVIRRNWHFRPHSNRKVLVPSVHKPRVSGIALFGVNARFQRSATVTVA